MVATYAPSGIEVTVPSAAGRYNAFPAVAGSGAVSMAAWSQSDAHVPSDPDLISGDFSRSLDGGATWTPFTTVVTGNIGTTGIYGIAGLAYVPGTNTWVMIYGGQVFRSTDNGDHWTTGPVINYGGTGQPFPTSLTWVSDGTASGLLLATAYGQGYVRITASADGGLTWVPRYLLASPGYPTTIYTEPTITALPDGSLLCFIRIDTGPQPGIWQMRSTDRGVSWTAPVRIIAVDYFNGLPVAISYQGVLSLLYRTDAQWNWAWASSDDNGVTWTPRGDFTPGGHRSLYGGWAPLSNGDLLAVYSKEYSASDARIFAQRFAVTLPPALPGSTVPVPSVATATPDIRWLGCDLETGQIIAELTGAAGNISRVINAYTSASVAIPLAGGPSVETILESTRPRETLIVYVVNDVPTWGGIPLTREGGIDGVLSIGAASCEAYLDHRFVGDHAWVQADQSSTIAAGLLAEANVDGIGLIIDAPASGVLRDRTYFDDENASTYSRLGELVGVDGGIEWTIELVWADDTKRAVSKIVRVRSRLGTPSTQPGAIFSTRGESDTRYTLSEDHGDGRGANSIKAYSAGEGDLKLSALAQLIGAGQAIWQRRYTPSNGITVQDTLQQHVNAELARRQAGATIWKINARWDAYPRLGVDWQLGDDVGFDLAGHRHPNGVTGRGRVIGWEFDTAAGRVTPLLYDDSEVS